jgi:hypothetical protein
MHHPSIATDLARSQAVSNSVVVKKAAENQQKSGLVVNRVSAGEDVRKLFNANVVFVIDVEGIKPSVEVFS